jgi:hypothetical protein
MLFHGLSAVDVSSCAALAAVQGLTVALPRGGRASVRLRWLWLAPPVLFSAAVLVLALQPRSAGVVSAIAFVAVPALALLAAVRLARGSRPAWALVVPVLLVASLSGPQRLSGQLGITLLCALSAVALGAMLVRLGGVRGVVLGLVALAAADVALVADGSVGAAANALTEVRLGELPELSHVALGTFTLGYGDLFVAGVAGAIASRRRGGQLRVAALTTALMLLESAFLAGKGPYPATVPVVVALVADEVAWWLRTRRPPAAEAAAPAPARPSLAAVPDPPAAPAAPVPPSGDDAAAHSRMAA